jgi:Phasin protein
MKVPMIKNFDDMQKMSNANMEATKNSFDAATKSAQAIATEITDYTKRSFEHGTKTMENLLSAKSLEKAIEVQSELRQGDLRGLCRAYDEAGPTLHRSGQGGLQAVREHCREGQASKVMVHRGNLPAAPQQHTFIDRQLRFRMSAQNHDARSATTNILISRPSFPDRAALA